jgi:hypothetical protein
MRVTRQKGRYGISIIQEDFLKAGWDSESVKL